MDRWARGWRDELDGRGYAERIKHKEQSQEPEDDGEMTLVLRRVLFAGLFVGHIAHGGQLSEVGNCWPRLFACVTRGIVATRIFGAIVREIGGKRPCMRP